MREHEGDAEPPVHAGRHLQERPILVLREHYPGRVLLGGRPEPPERIPVEQQPAPLVAGFRSPIQDRDHELQVVFDRPVRYGPATRPDPARAPRPDEPIPVAPGQGGRIAVPSEKPEEHLHGGPVVPPRMNALGGRHLLTVGVKQPLQRERLGLGFGLAVGRVNEACGELIRLPLRARPIAVLEGAGEPAPVLSPLNLEHAGLRVGEDPDPVPAPLAGAVAPAASSRASHRSIPLSIDGLHDLRERNVAEEGVFDQWQVVGAVRPVPKEAVQAHDRGSLGAWRAARLREAVAGPVRGRAGTAHVKPTSMCAIPQFGRAPPRLRMSLSGFRLHHGLRGGCAAREPEAVTGATPRRGRLACHGGGLGCACHPNPPREVAPGQRSLAGRPSDARDERVPSLRGEAERPDGQAVGPNVRRLLEAALGTGAPLAVLQPPARQRHRRAGAVSGRAAISRPATPTANRTRRTSHHHPHPAVITGRGGEGLDPGGRNGRSPCRSRGDRRRQCSPVTPRTQPQSRRASTGGDRPPPERNSTGGHRGHSPLASLRRDLAKRGPKE